MNLCEELNINWRYCPGDRQTQKERKDAGHLGKVEAKLWVSPDWHWPPVWSGRVRGNLPPLPDMSHKTVPQPG